jgi:hypothetical protein
VDSLRGQLTAVLRTPTSSPSRSANFVGRYLSTHMVVAGALPFVPGADRSCSVWNERSSLLSARGRPLQIHWMAAFLDLISSTSFMRWWRGVVRRSNDCLARAWAWWLLAAVASVHLPCRLGLAACSSCGTDNASGGRLSLEGTEQPPSAVEHELGDVGNRRGRSKLYAGGAGG